MLKDGRLFWFKSDHVTQDVVPRGVIKIDRCLSIKGAEEAVLAQHGQTRLTVLMFS